MTRKNEGGNILLITALALTVLMGFAGLAVDIGVLRYQKRLQQTAADAAAIAGADELRYGKSNSEITSAALNAATTNAFGGTTDTGCPPPSPTGGVGSVAVAVNNPPCSGPHSGNPNYVEVYVSKVQPTFFMPILGINNETVTARAVATLVSDTGTGAGCVYTLGVGISGDLSGKGTPTLYAPSCGIEDDGGLTANSPNVNITAGSIGVADMNLDKINIKSQVSPAPVGIPPVGDPLSFFPTPTSGTTSNGIAIHNGTVNFASGTYIVNGNFTVDGNSTVTGTGVTFYVTGNITINGTSTVQLSAPNSGPYAGMLFWDPSQNITAKLDGTNTSYYQGAIYVPGSGSLLTFGGTNFTNVTCTGTSTTNCAQYTIIVADQLEVHGTSNVNIGSNYSGLPGGVTIIEHAILVE